MTECKSKKTILIIDDDEYMRYSLGRILEGEGYNVLEAGDGADGMRAFHANTVDLIVTDILMPEKEGLEIITELRNNHPAMPIVAISGGGQKGDLDFLEVAKVMGAAAVLLKPIDIKKFLQTIAELLV